MNLTAKLQLGMRTDIRALALMRIAVAAVLLLDIGIRFTDIDVFYTDYGATPADPVRRFVSYFRPFSLFYLNSNPLFTQCVFLMHALFACCLLLGWNTRIMTLLCWVLLVSDHNRSPMILQGGDDLMRLVLFWGLFLPWGKRYSIDALHQSQPVSSSLTNWATVAYGIQIASVYFFSALLKGKEWHVSYSAMYYAYHLDQIAHPLAVVLREYEIVLKILTAVAFYFELLIPILLFWPSPNSRLRFAGVLAIIAFHLCIGVTLFVGLFFIIGIATVLGLLPGTSMDVFEQHTQNLRKRIRQALRKPVSIFPHISSPGFLTGFQPVTRIFVMAAMAYILVWNIANIKSAHLTLSDVVRKPGHWLRLDQSWGMFAPGVLKNDGWYIYEAIVQNGDTLDLNRNNHPVDYSKPQLMVSLFKDDRWRKFSENYASIDFGFIRGYLCEYLCNQWNQQHPENKIVRLRILFMKEVTLPDYAFSKPVMEELYVCGDGFNPLLSTHNQK